MERWISYSEHMKQHVTQKQKEKRKPVTSLYCQMVLDEAWFKLKKERLEEAIDLSLENRDRASFMTLSKEYNTLMQTW